MTYQQFTDESGDGIREIPGDKEIQQGTSDMDGSQWSELDLGGKVQTIFFLTVSVVYIPVGIWMLKQRHSNKPHVIALGGSLSLILFYVASRTIIFPIVGIQNDVGSIDVIAKIFQSTIVVSSTYLIVTRRKLENNISSHDSK
ncbi:MAG: hypothetical protein ACREAT_06790 [Nitrosotalea sp.]